MNAFCNEAPRQNALPDGREIFGIPFIHIQQQGCKKCALLQSLKNVGGGLSVFEAPLVGQILYLVKIQENFAASRRRCEKAQAEFFPPPLFISIFFTNTHFCKNYGIMV
ncbi:MAG: hypothetical protein ACI3XN_02295 [Eubacteriales bacterium]